MSDSYEYNYDQNNYDQNYDQAYDYNQNANYSYSQPPLDEVNLPPPPTNPWNQNNDLKINTPPPPPIVKSKPKKEKKTIELKSLEGWQAYKVAGLFAIGNLPFPIVNPNFFKLLLHSGYFILLPISLFELIFVFVAVLLNIISNWLYLAGSLKLGVGSYPPYIALRVLWAHISICLIPVLILPKYCAIFKACTESNLIIKAPLFIIFCILIAISMLVYLSMWSGFMGSGIFTGIFLFFGGLFGGPDFFPLIVGILELLGSISWLVLIVCCIIQIIGMIRSFIIFRRAQRLEKEEKQQASIQV